jgi:hypothetical protein
VSEFDGIVDEICRVRNQHLRANPRPPEMHITIAEDWRPVLLAASDARQYHGQGERKICGIPYSTTGDQAENFVVWIRPPRSGHC